MWLQSADYKNVILPSLRRPERAFSLQLHAVRLRQPGVRRFQLPSKDWPTDFGFISTAECAPNAYDLTKENFEESVPCLEKGPAKTQETILSTSPVSAA
jgi:hypothetical protein